MKLIVTDESRFNAVKAAFQGRETFTLTGAGVTTYFLATGFSYSPNHAGIGSQCVELEFVQVSKAAAPSWNGEGLPPVGLEFEVLWSSECATYVRAKAVAHDEGRVVFRFLDGGRSGEYQAERVSTYNDGQFTNFRPIRTAEQIAAEEREKAVQQMVDAMTWGAHVPETRRKIAYDLYDAGARMPGEGQKA